MKFNHLFLGMVVLGFIFSCDKSETLQTEIDEGIIQSYMETSSLSYTKHTEGFYYHIEDQGTGSVLQADSVTVFTYTISDLNDGTTYYDVELETANELQKKFGYFGNSESSSTLYKTLRSMFLLVNEGAKVKMLVPAHLAFGRNGNGVVPSNQVVKIEFCLIDFETQDALEEKIIKQYIAENNITGLLTTTEVEGFYYKVHEVGTGTQSINVYAELEVGYELTDMYGNQLEVVDKDSPTTISVAELIEGAREALVLVRAGGKVECIFLSKLGYNDKRALHYVFDVVSVEY